MRPDLIAAVKLGDQSKVGSLLKINGISNPFSLKEGRFILIPSQSTIDRSFDVKKLAIRLLLLIQIQILMKLLGKTKNRKNLKFPKVEKSF